MKFLVDAQLPKRFAQWLTHHGHDALHTLDLPLGNRTPEFRCKLIRPTGGRPALNRFRQCHERVALVLAYLLATLLDREANSPGQPGRHTLVMVFR